MGGCCGTGGRARIPRFMGLPNMELAVELRVDIELHRVRRLGDPTDEDPDATLPPARLRSSGALRVERPHVDVAISDVASSPLRREPFSHEDNPPSLLDGDELR